MGKEVSYNEAVVDYLYNTEYSDVPKEKFLSAIKENKEVVDYLYNQHYSDSNYDDFLIAIGYQPVKKKRSFGFSFRLFSRSFSISFETSRC